MIPLQPLAPMHAYNGSCKFAHLARSPTCDSARPRLRCLALPRGRLSSLLRGRLSSLLVALQCPIGLPGRSAKAGPGRAPLSLPPGDEPSDDGAPSSRGASWLTSAGAERLRTRQAQADRVSRPVPGLLSVLCGGAEGMSTVLCASL